jgi:hypothetical protein
MMREIRDGDSLIAIIIRKNFKSDGIKFFTKGDNPLQLGYMNRKKDYEIEPHIHLEEKREISLTQEVLFIKSGEVSVKLYSKKMVLLERVTLFEGDFILLASGGHGFTMKKDTEILEIKQGPYLKDLDKKRF